MSGAECEEKARWFVVKTMPRAEGNAAVELARGGYEVFFPLVTKEYRHNRTGGWRTRQFPMFHRYLFIKVTGEPDVGKIRKFDGVMGVLHNEGKAVPINTADVERARDAQLEGRFDVTRDKFNLKVGNRVRVVEGAAKGFYGLVVDLQGRKQVRLLLGALQEVTTAIENVEPAWY